MTQTQTATFAGGCFWCTASAFDGVQGIEKVISGYMGGDVDNPDYESVCTGYTGHAEVVQITFDPRKVSYETLLALFFQQIDPTDRHGSFMDRGSQYRPVVFYHSGEQQQQALGMIQRINDAKIFKDPVVTEVTEALKFYPAEAYHQDYHKKNCAQYKLYRVGSCRQGFITRVWNEKNQKILKREKTTEYLMHVPGYKHLQIKEFMEQRDTGPGTWLYQLNCFMGERPEHFPGVDIRVAYDQHAICVHFRVRDQYIRAVAKQHQDEVYKDSCVEFFFTPGPDPGTGYFNLEMNCGGTMLFHFQPNPREDKIILPQKACNAIPVVHTLARIIDPEITEPRIWEVAYAIPFELLEAYYPVVRPGPGVVWRGNFYKCADATSHPHWLTWAPVAYPRPNFHCPEYFGSLVFNNSHGFI